jgi:hypothetical protein
MTLGITLAVTSSRAGGQEESGVRRRAPAPWSTHDAFIKNENDANRRTILSHLWQIACEPL